jgi:valyl-tRNA synthetase
MADPKIKEKRWTVDLEKKIQEEHFSKGQRYTFNPNSEKEIFVIDTPPPYPSGTWHIGAVAQYSMIDVIARSREKCFGTYF